MPIQQVFDTQDAVPEFLKEAVVERDGKFVFEAETVAEVGNLKTALKKERTSREKLEAETKKLERFKPLTEAFAEADEEEVGEFLTKWQKRGEEPEPGGKPSKPSEEQIRLREQQERVHAREIKKRDDAIAALTGEIGTVRNQMKEDRKWTGARDLYVKGGGLPEFWDISRLELREQGRIDLDEDGKLVVMEDGAVSSVTPDKFFKEVYSEQRPMFYKSSGAGGSGATNAGRSPSSKKKTVSRYNQEALNANFEAIARGEVEVVD